MAEAARPVFISYARLDQPLVARAVEFLRAGGLHVFVDSQSIAYGTDWRQALGEAIENAERVMLFWTAAAAASRWVTREWQLALKRGKKVVPTLLDDTPLPPALARLHAVTTLRGLFPAPVRRPEDLIAEPTIPDETPDDEGFDPGPASPGRWAANPSPTASAASRSRASPPRAIWIVPTLAVVGLVGWMAAQRSGTAPDRPYPSPQVGQAPAPVTVPGVGVPPPPAAVTGVPGPASKPTPVPPAVASAPAPGASRQTVIPLLLLALALTAGTAWLLVRRRLRSGRARAIVQELYSV
jgi:hypothetical protein